MKNTLVRLQVAVLTTAVSSFGSLNLSTPTSGNCTNPNSTQLVAAVVQDGTVPPALTGTVASQSGNSNDPSERPGGSRR